MTGRKMSPKELDALGLTSRGQLKMYFDPYVQEVFDAHPDWTDLQIARQASIHRKQHLAQIDYEASKVEPSQVAKPGLLVLRDAEAKAVVGFASRLVSDYRGCFTWLQTVIINLARDEHLAADDRGFTLNGR